MKKTTSLLASAMIFFIAGCNSPIADIDSNTDKEPVIKKSAPKSSSNHVIAIAYEHTGFQGESYPIYSDWADSGLIKLPLNWNDEISSVKIVDKDYGVEFYEHNHGDLGKMTELNVRIISQLDWGDLPNDSFSGLKVYRDTKYDDQVWYRLWEDTNYKGAYVEKYSPDNCSYVGSLWNDRISSIEVCGPAAFGAYEHSNYRGNQKWFGSTPYVGDAWNDKITSHVNDALGM